MVQEKSKIQPISNKQPRRRRWLKYLGVLLLLLFFLVIGILVLIQTYPVQNWLVDKATHQLSKQLQTKVTLQEVGIDFFDQVSLKNFYVEDFHGDTLLHSAALKVNLNTSLSNIIQRDIEVTDITLVRPQFRLTRYKGEQKDQLQQLLDKLSSTPSEKPSNDKEGTPWLLEVDAVYLEQAIFIKEDSVGGEVINVFLNHGDIQVEQLDLQEKIVKLESIALSQPIVSLINFEKNALPKDTTTTVIKLEIPKEQESVSDKDKKWQIQATDFQLIAGVFEHHNFRNAPVKTKSSKEIDFNHLLVEDIQMHFTDFSIQDWVFEGASEKFSLKESTGFIIENITTSYGIITPEKVELQEAILTTPNSKIKDHLLFQFKEYPDFKDFPNKVHIEGQFDQSYVALKDIMHFAPNLRRNQFFAQNRNEILYINGQLQGKVNDLKGRNLVLNLGNAVRLTGDFAATNLTQPDLLRLNMDLKRLQTDMTTLRALIPNMTLPENFNKLGTIDFNGKFEGLLSTFKANGNLKTDLGGARVNMLVDTRGGRELATYTGKLDLLQFDLARWADNSDFGIVSMSSTVKDGKGLTLAAANALLETNIEQFYYRGYTLSLIHI